MLRGLLADGFKLTFIANRKCIAIYELAGGQERAENSGRAPARRHTMDRAVIGPGVVYVQEHIVTCSNATMGNLVLLAAAGYPRSSGGERDQPFRSKCGL